MPEPAGGFQGDVFDDIAIAQVAHGVRALVAALSTPITSTPVRGAVSDVAASMTGAGAAAAAASADGSGLVLQALADLRAMAAQHQSDDLVPDGQHGLRFGADVDFIVVHGIRRVDAARH